MPRSAREKALLGAAGLVGAGLVSWRTFFPWISHDLQLMKAGIRVQKQIMADNTNRRFLIKMFEENVQNYPEKPFVIFEDKIYTYKFMNEQANRVANIALDWKLNIGETVAIMITNEPAFIWTFLGLQKLGIAVAFLNYNVKGQGLIHTIQACEAKVLIVGEGENILHAVQDVRPSLGNIPIYVQGRHSVPGEDYLPWDELMRTTLPVPISPRILDEMTVLTPCCYIFTSGTTGLPKPAVIRQTKAIGISKLLQLVYLQHDDILYATTPLYHSAAGGLGLMGVLHSGATMVLRRKFSAHHYFEDCRKYQCTVVQYIGELCRYLLALPKSPLDGVHNIRIAIGNGLRSDIWEEFQTRFKIPHIREFFGATEGTGALINLSEKSGACGRLSPFLRVLDRTPNVLVKYDLDKGEEIRDKNGHCIPVKPGETGLFLGAVTPMYQDLKFYKGTREINEKKVLRDVLKPGDIYYNFGDLLELDKDYFVYFKDRTGDTFRWKGENVATYEVSNALTQLDFVHDANVYGVEVPGSEGRAGMAVIHLEEGLSITPERLQKLYEHCKVALPGYSRPLFLRFPKDHNLTTTLKQQKVTYRKEGFNPDMISDPVYYWDDQNQTYSSLTTETMPQFMAKAKL